MAVALWRRAHSEQTTLSVGVVGDVCAMRTARFGDEELAGIDDVMSRGFSTQRVNKTLLTRRHSVTWGVASSTLTAPSARGSRTVTVVPSSTSKSIVPP